MKNEPTSATSKTGGFRLAGGTVGEQAGIELPGQGARFIGLVDPRNLLVIKLSAGLRNGSVDIAFQQRIDITTGQQPDGFRLPYQTGVGHDHVTQLNIDTARQKLVGSASLLALAGIDADGRIECLTGQLVPVDQPQCLLVGLAVGRDDVLGKGHIKLELGLHESGPASADDGSEQDDEEAGGKGQRGDAVPAEAALGGIALAVARMHRVGGPVAGRCRPGLSGGAGHQSYCSR
jgi:hypothetical protein